MPFTDRYRPDQRHPALGPLFFDPVRAADFPRHRLRWRNDDAARTVGLDTLTHDEWIAHFGHFEPLPGNLPEPLALRYHGHQFRAYNPDIGDGRGFLYAQLRDADGRLMDLGTKGTGTTPHSRSGDGRLTLKGAVRELLASETLYAMGVPTSRTLSIVETGERLWRGDEPSPTRSAALVRLQRSHVRIGTFQRLAYGNETEAIGRLVEYCAETYGLGDGDPARFLDAVTARVADTGAAWWVAGFVHGVLNTDNIVVTGESFDYGPWRFLEEYDPGKVAAYFDHSGLYAFGRQPEALSWNLTRLAECLVHARADAHDALVAVLEGFPARFEAALVSRTHAALGLATGEPATGGPATGRPATGEAEAARERVRLLYRAMRETRAPHHGALHDLAGGAAPGRLAASPRASLYEAAPWTDALAALREAEPTGEGAPAPPDGLPLATVERLWNAVASDDDWRPLRRHLDALAHGTGEPAAPG